MAYPGNAWDRRHDRYERDHLRGHHHHDYHNHRDLRSPRTFPRDQAVDQIGDYVARRLVPELQRGSERPVQLVMNFGSLYVEDGFRGDSLGNSVIYNGPGCSMVLGSSGSSTPRSTYGTYGYGRYSPTTSPAYSTHASPIQGLGLGGLGTGLAGVGGVYSTGPLRTCPQCGVRRVIRRGGVCQDCDLDTTMRSRETTLRAERLIGGTRREEWDEDYIFSRYPRSRSPGYASPVW